MSVDIREGEEVGTQRESFPAVHLHRNGHQAPSGESDSLEIQPTTQHIVTDRPAAISTEHLGRIYKVKGEKGKGGKGKRGQAQKTLVALDDVTLEVYEGELFGLL